MLWKWLGGKVLGEKRRDWLEDVLEGDEVFVEQAALLHQVQAGGQTRQPADSKEKTLSWTQPPTLRSDFIPVFTATVKQICLVGQQMNHLMKGQHSTGVQQM